MKILTSKPKLKALSLVEILVAIAVLTIIIGSGYQVFRLSLRAADRARQFTIAEALTLDLIELTVAKRNEDWNSIVVGEYYLAADPDPNLGFVFTPGTETIDEFTRSITISAVERDVNSNIVASGTGTVDINSFFISAKTTWSTDNQNFEVEFEQYITNWGGF